jgi:L-ascorbate metabolism protein UlaG (beta-lactamase superfamily)
MRMILKSTGRLPSGNVLQRIKESPNYKEGAFQNVSPTPMKQEGVTYWKMIRTFFRKHPGRVPERAVPYVKTDLINVTGPEPVLIWFGHSSYLIRIQHRTILVDPVFSGNAAPVSFMVPAFPGSNSYQATDMPEIDYLIITHDHYDHLDFKTIQQLHKKVKKIYCSLGISSHLRYWGIDEHKITEMDWWQSGDLEKHIQLTATPARHFSGRGIKRGQTLWSSFILKTATHQLFLGGDSGYDQHFKEIGTRFGPFDLAILEAGQYNTMWPLIHMMPEETVQATLDLGAKTLLPVHWGKFSLSMHPWDEPVKRVLKQAGIVKLKVYTPVIGQPLVLDGHFQSENWWETSR